ncbi:hypothetical protein LZB55_08240, partial [Campylobacter lari]|nr:hypothetical protein [Campylobacter lari]
MFPMRLGPIDMRHESENFYVGYTLDAALDALLHQVGLELQYVGRDDPALLADSQLRAIEIVRQFGAELPRVRAALDLDVT